MIEPSFYTCRTLLSYHPSPDLNRVTLYGPNDFQFILYEIGEPRRGDANERCAKLAVALCKLWDQQKGRPEGRPDAV